MKSRIVFVCFILFLFYVFFVAKGALLQFFPDERIIAAKKRNFEKVIQLKPRRGIIYDRFGKELAISIASQSLFADPFLIENPRRVSIKLSRLLKVSSRSIYQKIRNKSRRFVWLKRHLTEKEYQIIQSWKNQGLSFFEEPKRIYPNGSLLAQTLGFVGHDGHGLEGIELSYNRILSGEEKKILVQKDAMGRPLVSDMVTDLMTFRANGADIYLTIDSRLQFFFEKELKKTVEYYSARSALGIIMQPQTGEILAMAHFPGFDLNKPFQSDPELFRNRSVVDAFEPGSTFKPFVILTALKQDISPSVRYSGMGGKFSIEGHIIKEAESSHQFEDLGFREIISQSSNIGSAQVALQIGSDFLYDSLNEFGFGNKLGFQFPGEGAGILNKPPWTRLQLATIGFGHSVSVTPLQLATAYSAIANGGLLKKPYLVKSIHYKESGRRENFLPKTLRRILTEQQAKMVTIMLISAMSNEGTGWRAQVKGFMAAGKTGTAQVVDSKKGGYVKGLYISSFAGFIPAHNPKFVIYLAIEQPQKKFYGSTVAAPVFSKVAEYAVRKDGLSPSLISMENLLKTTPLQLEKKENRSVSSLEDLTPDFIGLSLRDAVQKAKKTKVMLKVKGFGRVNKTIPNPGEPLSENRNVRLIMQN